MYGECECFVMHMLYVCVLCASCCNAAFCMTFSLLMLVKDAIGDHTLIFIHTHTSHYLCGGIARFTRVLFELPCYPQFELEIFFHAR